MYIESKWILWKMVIFNPPHFILLLFVFSISSIYLRNYPYLSINNFRFLTKHWRSKHRPWFNLIQVIQRFYLHYSRTFYHHISYSSVRKQEISLLNSENKLWGNLCSNRIRKLIEKLLGASLLWGNIEWWKWSTDEILHVAGYDHTIILVSTDKSLKSVFALKLLLKVMMLINITLEWLVEFFSFLFSFSLRSKGEGRGVMAGTINSGLSKPHVQSWNRITQFCQLSKDNSFFHLQFKHNSYLFFFLK